MRSSTVLSLLVAIILGVAAVFGVRTWLADQRAQMAVIGGARSEAATNSIVVAKQALRFGDRLTPDKLEVIPWASATLPNGAFVSVEELGDNSEEHARFALSAIEKGEPVLASRITDPGQRAKLSTAIKPGMKALSIRVNDVAGVAGFVLPGDRVDVLLTRNESANRKDDAYTDVLLQGVRVLAIDQSADDRKDQPSVVRTVTFEVTTEEAQKLTLGSSIGTLSLALRNVVSSDTEDYQRVTISELSDLGEPRLEEVPVPQPVAMPVAAEQPTPEPVIIYRTPPKPAHVTVGVMRDGKREEYTVNASQDTN